MSCSETGQILWNHKKTYVEGTCWFLSLTSVLFRSSCLEVFYKIGVLKTFAKFKEKHLCQSLSFNEVIEHLRWLLLIILHLIQCIIWPNFVISSYKCCWLCSWHIVGLQKAFDWSSQTMLLTKQNYYGIMKITSVWIKLDLHVQIEFVSANCFELNSH